MTSQEIFDKVVNHLRTQGRQAQEMIRGEAQCRYRTQTNEGDILKCAAGCLIPDEDYRPDFEGFSVVAGNLVGDYFGSKGYNISQVYMVRDLQKVHDYANLWARREESFKKVAEDFRLTYTPPTV